ncbi:sorting nexin-12 isoform X1 [Corythoichthys intestinalis]|uniref:sorting nexin-12 isoform X1 n=1 Tax=Corythoichthys intestinalis TaxID=161448 RepID=UPI0025A65F89|nr:sorting nexin-12 isoform X1 [Corythoichthys intestinalis]
MSEPSVADTRRLNSKPQDLSDAYGPPSNFLEIDVFDPQIVGVGRHRYTTYAVRMRTNLPIFKLKDSCVTRRYSDFEWLKNELERDSKIVVPPLPGKALKRQLPFRSDEGLFEESFIEERRSALEQFINRCLHLPHFFRHLISSNLEAETTQLLLQCIHPLFSVYHSYYVHY